MTTTERLADFKRRHPGMLLLFTAGDYYQALGDDAHTVATVLGMAVTNITGDFPLVLFHGFELESHLHKLLVAGHRVAICEPTVLLQAQETP